MATTHEPQLPAQQPESIFTPWALANSRRFSAAGSQRTVLFERANMMFILARCVVSEGVGAAVFFFTVAGPNASKKTSLSGTPHASRPSVMLFMNAPLPQR